MLKLTITVAVVALPGLASAQGYGPALPPAPPTQPAPDPYGPTPPPAQPQTPPDDGLVDENRPPPPPDDVQIGAPAELAAEASPAEDERKGLVIGVGLGLGAVRTDGVFDATRYMGLGFTADLGYMFSPQIAGLVELWYSGGEHPDDSNVGGQIFGLGVAVRWFAPVSTGIGRGLWVQGGLSSATFQVVSGNSERSGSGGELTLGVGCELVKLGPVVLDLQARLGFGSISGDGQDADFRQGSVLLGGAIY